MLFSQSLTGALVQEKALQMKGRMVEAVTKLGRFHALLQNTRDDKYDSKPSWRCTNNDGQGMDGKTPRVYKR